MHSNRIVGYSIDFRVKASPAVVALRAAFAQITGRHGGPLRRGSRFRSKALVRELRSAGPPGSMGPVGACTDSAAMEPCSALLQNNVLDRRRRATRQDLRLTIVTWIERTHHRRRRQRRLDRLTSSSTRPSTASHRPPNPPGPRANESGSSPTSRTQR